MSAERHVSEPGELVYAPRPSWAPAVFGFATAATVCGMFAGGFGFPPWIYSIVGGILMLAALRHMIRGSVRAYYRLPRRQRVRGAVLPLETIRPPQR